MKEMSLMDRIQRRLIPVKDVIQENFIFFVAAIFLIILISAIYIQKEHFFYFWDFGGFYGVSSDLTGIFAHSFRSGVANVYYSLDQEYNNLFVVPILPFTLVFGTSRFVFALSIACMYLLPAAMVLGLIIINISKTNNKFIFWLVVFSTLLVPIPWGSILRGYPDIGGVFFLLLGLYVFIRDPELKSKWQIPAVGFFFAAGPIFRRHFLYFSVAFFLIAGLFQLFSFIYDGFKSKSFQWKKLLGEWLRLFLAGIVLLIIFFIFVRPFLIRLLTNNYSSLYSSYLSSINTTLLFFVQEYGPIIWGIAAIGFVAAFITGIFDRRKSIFLALLAVYSVLQWAFIVRITSIHYALQVLFPIVVGWIGLALVLIRKFNGWKRAGLIAIASGLLLVNFITCLFSSFLVPPQMYQFLASQYRPLIRGDYDNVVGLVEYLRNLQGPHDSIYVVDSSVLMNYDLLQKAEIRIFGTSNSKLGFLVPPQVDSRDYYPLEQLIQSRYVIYSTPFQHHLDPEQQKVVKFVFDAFQQKSEIAQDFSELPQTFQLEGGVTLHIYQRIRPTSLETSVRTLDSMLKFIPQKPGGQLDWMVMDQNPGDFIRTTGNNLYKFQISSEGLKTGKTFLMAEPASHPGNLQGDISYNNSQCPGANLTLKEFNPAGTIVNTTSYEVSPSNHSFAIPSFANQKPDDFLAFEVSEIPKSSTAGPCDLSVIWGY
jgi:hypothetical protein